MQLVLHAGAHFTEAERLMKCLLRNKEAFRDRGVVVPGPGRYRGLLRDTVAAMGETGVVHDARDLLLEAILDNEIADRVLLSHPHFFSWPRAAVRGGMLYPLAAERMAHLASIFRDDDIELFVTICNPASFIPASFEKNPRNDFMDFLDGTDPRDLRWSDTFAEIRQAAPEVPVTVWCNEDAPFLWSQVIREMAGMEHGEPVVGGFDLFGDIMSKEGMARFAAYLKSKPEMTEIHVRRVMAAFLDKFARDDAIETELDIPGWTDVFVEELTELYDEDVVAIGRIPGVELISL